VIGWLYARTPEFRAAIRHAFFVPHDREPTEPSRDQRRELGAVFLREVLRVVRLASPRAAP